jgi:hypothetical protein
LREGGRADERRQSLEIMRLQFFTAEEVRQLAWLLAEHGP